MDEILAYKITPVYKSGFSVLPALMTSMISGTVIANSGGGGDFITPKEYHALKKSFEVSDAIASFVAKPEPKPVNVLVALEPGADFSVVQVALRGEGFAFKNRTAIGSIQIISGEIYDTYLDNARAIPGVAGVELDTEFKTS
jgi:hypothetical protein